MKNILLLAGLASTLSLALAKEQCFGSFKTLQHDVQGKVCAKDAKTLVIYSFSYDGTGPDAFFWIGKSGIPKSTDEKTTYILNENNQNYEYRDQSAPKLGQYKDQTIVLTLPEGWQMSDIKWISVWCRQFSVNFGELVVPNGFQIQDDDIPHPAAPEPEPEDIPHNHIDDHDHDHDHDHDLDHEHDKYPDIDGNHVDAEPEAEPSSKAEPEPEPESGAAALSALLPAAIVAALAAIIV